MERGGPARTLFPDIYREFESLQSQVRQAAQDYIISPQGGAMPLEVRNIEVRRSTVFNSVVYCVTTILLCRSDACCCRLNVAIYRLPGPCNELYCVLQVARSLGILDEVNRMKVVPGASPSSSLTNKNVRYMEVKTPSAHSSSDSRFQVWSGSSLDLDSGWIWFQYVYVHTGVFRA